tara:strand:+ start:3164 stop:3532 length:369 start_codon:yes stop_codon:yes gene_type:complete
MTKILSPKEIKKLKKEYVHPHRSEAIDNLFATLDQRTEERDESRLRHDDTAKNLQVADECGMKMFRENEELNRKVEELEAQVKVYDICEHEFKRLKEENEKLKAQIKDGYTIGDSIPIRFKK